MKGRELQKMRTRLKKVSAEMTDMLAKFDAKSKTEAQFYQSGLILLTQIKAMASYYGWQEIIDDLDFVEGVEWQNQN